jgi:hypothetical protein
LYPLLRAVSGPLLVVSVATGLALRLFFKILPESNVAAACLQKAAARLAFSKAAIILGR